jgi:hypothetical protein
MRENKGKDGVLLVQIDLFQKGELSLRTEFNLIFLRVCMWAGTCLSAVA